MSTETFEQVIDENLEDARMQRVYVGAGAMICKPCNIALMAPVTGYITTEYCPRCAGALQLRSLL
jgi:hypothetical protein